jgi:U3 small nucleolar RNA-associated protein MPP10
LITTDVDSEQIWAQLQLFNKPLFKYFQQNIEEIETNLHQQAKKSKSSADEDSQSFDSDQELPDEYQDDDSDNLDAIPDDFDEIPHGLGDSDDEDLPDDDDSQDIDMSNQPDDSSDSDSNSGENQPENDDDEDLENDPFFDREEMEAFLDGDNPEEDDEEDDDELIDYLNNGSGSEEEIDWEKMKEGKLDLEQKKDLRYDDFFKPPEKSTKHQKRQEELQQQIQDLEDQNIATRPWQLKGEVSSKERPTDSLLEEYVIFDHATKVIINFLFFFFQSLIFFNLFFFYIFFYEI